MSFYDEVLRELVAALGGALFAGNLFALVRRQREGVTAPVGRTLVYLVLGFVVMVWGIGSLLAA